METTELVKGNDAQLMESVLLQGDLSKLSPSQRVSYYQKVCESVGLNPLTKPFGYITLNGKLVLYALKDAAEQLRKNNHVSIPQLEKEFADDLYIVTAHAITPDGRADASTGAVSVSGLKGDAKANAIMKAETKAKRRVTLSICGMGFLDESEISSIPDARPTLVTETGEISGSPEPQPEAMPYEVAAALEAKGKDGGMHRLDTLNKQQLEYVFAHNADRKISEGARIVLEHDYSMTQTDTEKQNAEAQAQTA